MSDGGRRNLMIESGTWNMTKRTFAMLRNQPDMGLISSAMSK